MGCCSGFAREWAREGVTVETGYAVGACRLEFLDKRTRMRIMIARIFCPFACYEPRNSAYQYNPFRCRVMRDHQHAPPGGARTSCALAGAS